MRATSIIGLAALVATLATVGVGAEEGATYAALQVAFQRELDARLCYLSFAARAEREGRQATACLFRAIATAESIHAIRFRMLIEQSGGVARWRPRKPVVGTTRDNLRAAIGAERRENLAVYPRFADYARPEFLYEPLAWFNYVRGAEATHARMFSAALERLEASGPDLPLTILVTAGPLATAPASAPPETHRDCHLCLDDGSAFAAPVKRCPNCNAGRGRFATFSLRGRP